MTGRDSYTPSDVALVCCDRPSQAEVVCVHLRSHHHHTVGCDATKTASIT